MNTVSVHVFDCQKIRGICLEKDFKLYEQWRRGDACHKHANISAVVPLSSEIRKGKHGKFCFLIHS